MALPISPEMLLITLRAKMQINVKWEILITLTQIVCFNCFHLQIVENLASRLFIFQCQTTCYFNFLHVFEYINLERYLGGIPRSPCGGEVHSPGYPSSVSTCGVCPVLNSCCTPMANAISYRCPATMEHSTFSTKVSFALFYIWKVALESGLEVQ